MEFSRQEYWSGLTFPSPWDLPHPGIEPMSPALQAASLLSESLGPRGVKWAESKRKRLPVLLTTKHFVISRIQFVGIEVTSRRLC